MSEQLCFNLLDSKEQKYISVLPQICALVGDEPNLTANLANISAVLKEVFGFFWVGFYIVEGEQLVLGPFQGSLACTRINHGKGVCGAAWKEARTMIVPDVNLFPGHIACSSLSQSEIVVPVMLNQTVVAVLDVDSDRLNEFDETDGHFLGRLCRDIAPLFIH